MIAEHYGYRTDLVSLRKRFGLSLRGASLKDLMEISEALNLSSRPLRLPLSQLGRLQRPAILYWNMNHFVVLAKVSRSHLTVHDPAVGIRKYALSEAGKHFTGVALELVPRADFRKENSKSPFGIRDLFSDCHGIIGSLFQILLLSLLIQIFSLATPFFMQLVVDDVLVKNDADLLTTLTSGFTALVVISVVTKAVRGFCSMYLVNQLNYNLGNRLLHHLIRLPVEYFEKRHMGDVVSRFNSIRPIQDFITGSVIAVIMDGLLATATLALMFVYSSTLTGVVLVSSAIHALFRVVQFRPLRNASYENITAQAKLDSIFMESIRSLQGIKLANKELDRQNTWRNQFVETINTDARIDRLTVYYEAASNCLTGLEYVLVIFLGAQSVLDSQISIGMMYAFMAYRSNFSDAFTSIINQAVQYKMLDLHIQRLSDITGTAREPGLETRSMLLLPVEGSIDLRNVSFRYANNEAPIFSNVNLKIGKGDFVVILGLSGAGKTTLLKVLMGMLAPCEGEIFVDDMPLRTLGHRSYRHHLAALMPQDTLFSGSLKDNISFFDLTPDHKRIESVCELVRVHDDIQRTPMGYDSLVGDMGSSFSEGQQQRILLARALYRNPKILFLDEGTAHLDEVTEQEILTNLRSLGITCIHVTHNRNILKYADKAITLTGRQVTMTAT